MNNNEYKEFSISKEGIELLKTIKNYQLNNFNLKEIYEKGMLQSTRNEYEKTLTKNKEDVLNKYKIIQKINTYNGVTVYEYYPEKTSSNKICFHIHGGAFSLLNSNSSFMIPVQLSKICKIKVISIEFGNAPEKKYSEMVNNINKVINKFILDGTLSENIYLIGESSGGSLCVSSAYNLMINNIFIKGIILLSPWLDLSCNLISSDIDDPILCKKNYLDFAASLVINDEKDNNLLPFNLKYNNRFPKVIIQFGSKEILSEQILKFYHLLKKYEVLIQVECYKGLWHVFQSYQDLPETLIAMENIRSFISINI